MLKKDQRVAAVSNGKPQVVNDFDEPEEERFYGNVELERRCRHLPE